MNSPVYYAPPKLVKIYIADFKFFRTKRGAVAHIKSQHAWLSKEMIELAIKKETLEVSYDHK